MVHLYKRITRKILLDYPNTGSWWQRVSDDANTTDIPAMLGVERYRARRTGFFGIECHIRRFEQTFENCFTEKNSIAIAH